MFEPGLMDKINTCVTKGTPFAIFRLPGSKSICQAGLDGFDIRINDFDEPFSKAATIECYRTRLDSDVFGASTEETSYLGNVAKIKASHAGNKHEKTVLSRVITGHTDVNLIAEGAERLFDANPDAFCLMMQTPDRQIWLMATPELLLEVKGNRFKTMALAGTRPVSETDEPWDEKNRAEQVIVLQYLHSVFNSLRVEYNSLESFTLRSHNVEHICTEVEGSFHDSVDVQTLVDALSPTPAVCGYPVDKAKTNINLSETHKRGFYTGYTVVELPDGTLRIFVNLRCACVDALTGRYAIFVGGGITADSNPQSELIETNLKAVPMQSVLEAKPIDANM